MKKKSIIRKWTHALGFLQGLKKKKSDKSSSIGNIT